MFKEVGLNKNMTDKSVANRKHSAESQHAHALDYISPWFDDKKLQNKKQGFSLKPSELKSTVVSSFLSKIKKCQIIHRQKMKNNIERSSSPTHKSTYQTAYHNKIVEEFGNQSNSLGKTEQKCITNLGFGNINYSNEFSHVNLNPRSELTAVNALKNSYNSKTISNSTFSNSKKLKNPTKSLNSSQDHQLKRAEDIETVIFIKKKKQKNTVTVVDLNETAQKFYEQQNNPTKIKSKSITYEELKRRYRTQSTKIESLEGFNHRYAYASKKMGYRLLSAKTQLSKNVRNQPNNESNRY